VLQVRRQLRSVKLHVEVDVSDRTMQKKVREAQLSQYNYIFVIGEQEKVRGQAMGAWAPRTGGCLNAVEYNAQ
jgi:threonyl-tRNA synthetase